MDEEADFANILSQSTIQKPTWTTTTSDPSSDPWANPFSTSSPTNPFASSTSAFGSTSAYIPSSTPAFNLDPPESPRDEVSPYVAKLEEDDRYGRGNLPDPPSVIAAREQEANEAEAVFGNPYASQVQEEAFTIPYSPPRAVQSISQPSGSPPSRKLPSGLIDEDLMAASDPSISLKKAFVKSSPAPRTESRVEGKKAYVFTPGKQGKAKPVSRKEDKNEDKEVQEVKEVKEVKENKENKEEKEDKENRGAIESADQEPVPDDEKDAVAGGAAQEVVKPDDEPSEVVNLTEQETKVVDRKEEQLAEPSPISDDATKSKPKPDVPRFTEPELIPLPASGQATPSVSRIASPIPANLTGNSGLLSATNDLFSPNSTPKHDRVAVSPLDPPPPAEKDYGFRHLAIGGSSQSQSTTAPPPPPKSSSGWSQPSAATPATGSRFAGKGWAAVNDSDDLFGPGGPSVRSDPWGGGVDENDGEGWAGDNVPTISGASQSMDSATSSPAESSRPLPPDAPFIDFPETPSKRKTPLFQISVGDPTKVGDPVRGYTVYTVRTRTTSPHYRKTEISVLRRFSEFLWLFDALTLNNPGVIVPPMPDKQPWGRFQDQFVETRRQALQRCLTKITSHPILQLDPDLRLFLESDSFAVEAKNRRLEAIPEKTGLLANWTGPRYFEQDDWFDSRKTFLEALESQLKGLSKSIESASKARLELSISMGDYALSMTDLAESDLGSGMCAALARLSHLARQEKEVNENQAKGDVMTLLNMSDEYVRFIGSVRLAFAARIRAFHHWQNLEKEVVRMKSTREKLRQQGKLGDRVEQSLSEINYAERRVRDASVDFENISKLIKAEFVRFERERVEEFKRVLEGQLDIQIMKQKELIDAWEDYHGFVLKMVQKNQSQNQGR